MTRKLYEEDAQGKIKATRQRVLDFVKNELMSVK